MNPLRVINSISGTLKHLALAVPLAAALWLGAGPSAQAIPTDALIHYTFETGSISGATVTNNGSLGSAANGTMQNATSVAGQFGDGLSFTGSNSGVRTTGNVAIGDAFTFACWVSTTHPNNAYSRIIMNNFGSSGYLGTNNANPGKYLTIVKNQFVNNTTSVDTSGAWHHLVMTWDGAAQKFYYDGVLVSTTSQTGPTTLNSIIGFGTNSGSYGESWNGKMDEAFVFGRALSPTEITSLFTNAPNTAPDVPTSVTATPVSSGTVNVSWAADTNATSRDVSVTNTVSMVEQVFTTSAATSYSVTGLTNGTLYDFKVRATNGLGTSLYSDPVVSATPALSSAKDILTFLVPGMPDGVISGTNISVLVPFGTDVTTLAPTYSISPFASEDVLFPSGTPRNFTTPQTYTITAEDTTTQIYTVTVTASPDESTLLWNVAGGGAWNTTTINWMGQVSSESMSFVNGKNVIFDKTNGGTITIASGVLPASTTVSATAGTYAFSGVLDGAGTLTKSGGGTLQVRGYPSTNTFSGGTLVDGGTLGLGYYDGAVTYPCVNPLGSGPVTLSSGASINFDRVTASNALIVNGGQIQNFNGWGSEWSGPITLNATLTATVPNYLRLSGTISGTGGITKTGGNLLDLYGINTYSGNTTVSAGSLTLVDNAGLRFVLTDGASNKVTGAGTATFNGDFTIDTSAVTVTTGTWTLVDTATKSFSPTTFTVVDFTPDVDGVTWVMTASGKTWTFVETTGVLTLTSSGSDYDTWAADFLPADVSDPAADNDGDGLTNKEEYAFGLNPTLGTSVSPITVPLNKTTGMFTYTRRATPATTGLTYTVETSTDLAIWPTDDTATQTVIGTVGGVETVDVTLSGTIPLTAPSIFVRIKAAP